MSLNGAPVTTFPGAARNFVAHVWQQILSSFYPVEDVPGPQVAATPFAACPLPPIPESLPSPLLSGSLKISFVLPKGFLGNTDWQPIGVDLDFVQLVLSLLVVLLLWALRRSRARLSSESSPADLAYDLAGVITRAVGARRFSEDIYSAIIHHLQTHSKLNKVVEVDGEPTPNRSTELGPEHDPVTPARTSTSTQQRRGSPSPTRQRRAESPAPVPAHDQQRRTGSAAPTRHQQRRAESPAPTRGRQRRAESPLPTRERRASPSATRQRRATAPSTQQRRASGDYPEADDDVQFRQNHALSGDDENGDRHEHTPAPSTQRRRAPRDYPNNVQQHQAVRDEDEDGDRHTFDGDRGFMVDEEEEEEDGTASMHNVLDGVDAPREDERFKARQPRSFRGM
ncbi:hypothetical protein EST38_g1048 [Candolleomyces aberdarensis]|uniref:Uncharacterized protein n=1 Tax=Candolleomyces aberdarensis TaxID=2316362 RepID=A0A4Q2DZM4_9AGAR|nr:hypothetical protein EST38_g1048 [Candolleomyces aberdarensis]